MTVTPEQRQRAHDIAASRDELHNKLGHQRVTLGRHGKNSHYIGLLGEFATYNVLEKCTEVDLTFRKYGDGGVDLTLFRAGKAWKVDVKTSSYTGPGPLLKVPVKKIERHTIYVAAIYYEEAEDAYPQGWEWGQTLIQNNDRRSFGKSTEGIELWNYVMPYGKCRPMNDLFEDRRGLASG